MVNYFFFSKIYNMNSEKKLDYEKIWNSVLVNIELSISKANYSTWFKDTGLKEIKNENIAIVIVPSEFVKKWILEKFNSVILKSLSSIISEIRKVEYIVEKVNIKNNNKTNFSQEKKKTTDININQNTEREKKPLSLNLVTKNQRRI